MKETVEAYLSTKTKDAVLTEPAYLCMREVSYVVHTKMKETTKAYSSTTSNDEDVTELAYCNDPQCLATKGTTSIFVFNILPISDQIT